MSKITIINDAEQAALVSNNAVTAGKFYLKAEGSTNAGDLVIYNGSAWKRFANDAPAGFNNTYSVEFDGSDDGFNIPHNTDFNSGEHTISLWLKASSFGGYRNLIAKDVNASNVTFRIMLDGNKVIYYNGSIFTNTTTTLSTGTWYHIAASQSNTNNSLVIYINGVAQSFTNPSNSNTSNTADVLVGQWNSSYYFAGLIDEVSYFDSVLSASDISTLRGGASSGSLGEPVDISSLNPVGWWRMGDNNSGSGTTITDQGSGGNDGTLTNGPTFSSDVPS